MLDGLIGWLSEVDGRVSLFIVPVTQQHSPFDWSAMASTLVGGGATIAAALLAFRLSNRAERKRREEGERKAAAAHALSGYFKLSQWANLTANIRLHINRSYASAKEEGLDATEPFATIGPSTGKFSEPETLKPEEFSFLLSKEHLELINDVGLVEHRAINLHHLFQQYSDMHLEFQAWLDSLPGFEREINGPIASDRLPIEYKPRFDVRAAQLNRIIGGIIEHLDDDVKFSMETTQKFINAAHEEYSPHFPKMDFGLDDTLR